MTKGAATNRKLGALGIRRLWPLSAVIGLPLMVACASTSGSPDPGPGSIACRNTPTPLALTLGDTLTIATTAPVDPAHAPHPTTVAERLVFRHLYETLVWTDCQGRTHPGLATSWRANDRGNEWSFELAEEARFWDGAFLESADVLEGWGVGGGPEAGATGAAAHVVSGFVTGERTFTVTLAQAVEDVSVFADPRWAVAKTKTGAGQWPVGTGPFEVRGGRTGQFVLAGPRPGLRQPLPFLRFEVRSGSAARDVIDRGSAFVVTDLRSVLDYARPRADVTVSPMPWPWVFALLLPRGASSSQRPVLSDAFLGGLAEEAVRVSASAPPSTGWWNEATACSIEPRDVNPAPARGTVDRSLAYPSDDPVAQDLAERLVALTRSDANGAELHAVLPGGSADGWRTAPHAPVAFARTLRDATAGAYVVRLPARTVSRCLEMASLVRRAPWLASARDNAIVPVLLSQPWIVAIGHEAAPGMDFDGTPVFFAGRRQDWGRMP